MSTKLKRITAIFLSVIFMCISVTACKTDTTDPDTSDSLTKIRLNEVAHSIFYAPQYVAIELGYFKEFGIDLELTTGFGADKVMTALISDSSDIGFMGSESSVYVYAEGSQDYAVNFAQLTQRAGNFLVARENISNFKWSDLKGKKVLGGRAGVASIVM